MALACRLCVARFGLRGSEIAGLPQTEEELAEHMERDHHIIVTRDGETDAQAQARFLSIHPEAATCAECQDADAPWTRGAAPPHEEPR